MRIGHFTDIHIHKFQQFSGVDGYRRLNDGLNILVEIFNIFKREKCRMVVFTGDFFHDRKYLDVSSFGMTMRCMDYMLKTLNEFDKIAIPGNHDWYDRACKRSSIQFLEHYGFRVYYKPAIYVIEGLELVFIPWLPHKDQEKYMKDAHIKTKCERRLLYIHTTPIGSANMAGFIFNKGIELGKYSDEFDYIFCGDIHKRQYIGNNIVVGGAPMHHNFGDVGNECGVHVYDSKTNKVKFCSLKGKYPEFIITDNVEDINKRKKDYIKFITDDKDLLYDKDNIIISLKTKYKSKKRLKVDYTTSPEETIIKYAKKRGIGFSLDKLVEIGKEYIYGV